MLVLFVVVHYGVLYCGTPHWTRYHTRHRQLFERKMTKEKERTSRARNGTE